MSLVSTGGQLGGGPHFRSPKNFLWRPDRPHAYLIDRDGLRPVGGAVAQGFADPRWITHRLTARRAQRSLRPSAVSTNLHRVGEAPGSLGLAW